MSDQPKTDHVEEARRHLKLAHDCGEDEAIPTETAQAHASIAIAEELRGIRRTLRAMHQGAPIDSIAPAEEAEAERSGQ